jgi:hypothetical protein
VAAICHPGEPNPTPPSLSSSPTILHLPVPLLPCPPVAQPLVLTSPFPGAQP